MPKRKIIWIMTALFLAACSGAPSISTVTSTNAPEPSGKPTSLQPLVTLAVTSSPPALTLIPQEALLAVSCIETNQHLQLTSGLKGSILLLQEEDFRQVYLWNVETAVKYSLEKSQNEILHDFEVSPNGMWFALVRSSIDGIVTTSSKLEIWSSSGELQKAMPVGIDTFVTRWLDNERLLLSQGVGPVGKQWVLDPFTGEQINLDLGIDDLYNLPIVNNQWENALIYDPTLTLVVYAGAPADVVLVETENKNTIARISPAPVVHAVPKWSPDGKQVVVAYADILDPINDPKNWTFELYSIDREGKFNQLTNLSAYYNHPRIPFYYWSPDARFIAFWLETDPNQNPGVYEFSVLDLDTEKVTNHCIKNIPGGQTPTIFWSPDSEWAAVEIYKQNDDTSKDIVIVDIINGNAMKVAENLNLLGWMIAP